MSTFAHMSIWDVKFFRWWHITTLMTRNEKNRESDREGGRGVQGRGCVGERARRVKRREREIESREQGKQ